MVQWDHRNWRGTPDVRAIVGAFPEPFLNGNEGKRRPVRVECGDADEACATVKRVLRERGGARHRLVARGHRHPERDPRGGGPVGAGARTSPACAVLEQEPKRSGVFARFSEEGELSLLDERGRTVRDAGKGAGLVAAMVPRDDELVWVVTGGSGEGVDAAASALDPATLRDAFAVAVTAVRRREAAPGGEVSLIPVYRPLPSPLHAARAGATAALCLAFALVCALYEHPLILLAVLAGVIGAGVAAGVGAELRRTALLSVPAGAADRAGQPARLPGRRHAAGPRRHLPRQALGHHAGGARGGRPGGPARDRVPDGLRPLLRLRRPRRAAAAVPARVVPLGAHRVARHAARAGARARRRCGWATPPAAARSPPAAWRVARAALASALDRAVDVAAALEVRGYSRGGRPGPRPRRPWSRHDLRVAAAAALIAGAAVAGRAPGVGEIELYPALEIPTGAGEAVLIGLILLSSALPFAGAGARLGVARAG